MKHFEVWAETSQRVNKDGTIILDYDVAQDNIRYYVVEETDEDGVVVATKEYWNFDKIAEDHPASEWQNNLW